MLFYASGLLRTDLLKHTDSLLKSLNLHTIDYAHTECLYRSVPIVSGLSLLLQAAATPSHKLLPTRVLCVFIIQ